MNKNIVVVIVLILLVLLGVGGYTVLSKKSSVPGSSVSPSGAVGSAFTSIKDALSKSLSLECTFTDESGRQTKSYVKNGAVRADFTGAKPEESGSTIMKDKMMYFWNAQGGYKMAVTDEDTDQAAGTTPAPRGSATGGETNGSDVLESMEKFKESCKPAVVSDSLFTPPADVVFQDFSQMLKTVPTVGTTPVYDQAQIDKLMEQYAPTEAAE